MAELGFVGDGPNSYQLWLGGNVAQTTLAQEYMDRVKVRDLETVLEPLLMFWKNGRRPGEGFGYFTSRVGMEVCTPLSCCSCRMQEMSVAALAGVFWNVPLASTTLRFVQACHQFTSGYVSDSDTGKSVAVKEDMYEQIAARATSEGKSVAHMMNELLTSALKQ
jgi:hypothetical protein